MTNKKTCSFGLCFSCRCFQRKLKIGKSSSCVMSLQSQLFLVTVEACLAWTSHFKYMHPFKHKHSHSLPISWLHARFSFPVDVCLLLGEPHWFVFFPLFSSTVIRVNQEITRYRSPSVVRPPWWCAVCLHWRVTHTRSSCGMLNVLTRNNT